MFVVASFLIQTKLENPFSFAAVEDEVLRDSVPSITEKATT